MRHYVTHDGGAQAVYHTPVDRHAKASRVASATYTIVDLRRHEDDADRTIVASGAATVDSVNATLSAAAGPSASNPRRIQVDDVTGILEGHNYLLEGVGGLTELVQIDYTDSSNNYAYAKHDIRNVFATSDTLRGIELSGTFTSAEAADDDAIEDGGGPYGVIWTYTIDSTEYHPIDDLYVRRFTVDALCTEADVLQSYPRLADRARSQVRLEDAIGSASRHAKAELENAGTTPELVASETLTMAVVYRAIATALRWLRSNDGDADEADIEHYEMQYRHLMRTMLNGMPPSRTTKLNNIDVSGQPGGTKKSFRELFKPT